MKAIIYGADIDPRKWEACRVAYIDMILSGDGCEGDYTLKSGVRVHAQRGKNSITITVQPEASK